MEEMELEPVLVTLDVAQGKLRGLKTISKAGIPYYSFQGVPYAKPPVGPLRFKDALPPEPWFGVRDALEEGSACIQHTYMEGSEDCLYLNVYTPQLPVGGVATPLKPAMVYLHCCGYASGSGNTAECGPDFLVDEGVVLITINYRLGVLGFLCLNDREAPGNVGLKDQVAALRWVQQNIAVFGGAPSNVTIFGCASGGSSVALHMLSPMSKGLFSRAIAQSGAGFNPWGWDCHPLETTFRLGVALGNTTEDPKLLAEFLRSVDSVTLVTAATDHGLSERDNCRFMVFPFVPSMEVDLEGIERFLPGNPLVLLEAGLYHAMPYMTGINSDEGLLVLKFLHNIEWESIPNFEWNFLDNTLPDLRFAEDCPTKGQVCADLRNFYLHDKPICTDNLTGFLNMYTDILFGEGVHTTVKKMAEYAKAPLYYYRFAYDGALNFGKICHDLDFPGACHTDDLGYLFRMQMIDFDLDPGSPDAITRARMVKMWTNFAKTGNPTPEVTPLLPVTWPQHTIANPCYLNIGRDLSVGQKLYKDRMEFLENLYRIH